MTTIAYLASADFNWQLEYTVWECPLTSLLLMIRQKLFLHNEKQITLSDKEMMDKQMKEKSWEELVKENREMLLKQMKVN